MFNKYRELGLSLIPIRSGPKDKMKAPIPDGWTEFCERLPTEAECDAWERAGYCRYGLALGPAGGVMAVDIDSDDVKVIDAVKPSPVRKRGKKGETRFFRYDPEVPSTKVAGCIDILALGRQTLIPPTTHPDGMPYVWMTPDTLDNFPVDELPYFTLDDLNALRRALEPDKWESGDQSGVELSGGPWFNSEPGRGCPHGSHDRLKRIANALIARGASPDEAVRELLRYDEENHKPVGYFLDATRADCQADPVTNAMFFYASNARTFNRRQMRAGQAPSVPLVSGTELVDVSALTSKPAEAWKPLPWPEPRGGIRMIRELMRKASYRDIPALSLGGAVALGSVIVANRFKLRDSWPNVYVLNVAGTGSGKNTPYKVIKRALSPEHGLDRLLGTGGYRSSSAIVKDLLGKRERLDLIDECSSLFDTIRLGGVFQSDMIDILNTLWTDSSTHYIGPESVGRERVSVWHPCVSSLLSTTPGALVRSVTREFMSKGFLPRCLIFHETEYGEYRDAPVFDENAFTAVLELLNGIQMVEGEGQRRNLVSPVPKPLEIRIEASADQALRDYWREQAEETARERDDFEREFATRRGEQVTKLALIHGALDSRAVTRFDVEWAIETLAAMWHNALPLLPSLSAENTQESNMMRVLEIIRKRGEMTHSHLIGKTRFLKTSERSEILASLEAEGKIRISTTQNRARTYSII